MRVSFVLKLTPWISSQFYDDPLKLIIIFPPNFDILPWNSNYFYSTPLEISIDILNKFFLEKPNLRLFIQIIDNEKKRG